MKKTCMPLIILVVISLMLLPVFVTGQEPSNTTAVPTTAETTLVTTVTTQVTTEATTETTTVPVTTTVMATTTVPATTTAVPTTTQETTVPATTSTTVVTTAQTTQMSAGDISVASSPLGAAIIIDGVYHGTTPGDVTGLSLGTHMIRLSLSGYNDYEGTFYVVPGQNTPVYGTLHPISGASSQIIIATASAPATTVVPEITVQPTAAETSSAGPLENPTVVAAIIGVITAGIGALATIFPHLSKNKKNEEPPK